MKDSALFRALPIAACCLSGLLIAQTAPQPGSASLQSTPAITAVQHDLDLGRADAALASLEKMPPDSQTDRLRGAALYALGRFAEADTVLAAAIARDPADKAAMQLRGLTLFRLGRPAQAIPLLEKAHTWTSETRVDPAYVLALCYVATHQYDDARRAFAAQYGFAPDGGAAYLLAARMLLRQEYLPIAQVEAQKALVADPGLPLAHRLLGEIALAQAHTDEAISEFEKELQRNPLDGVTYDRLGDALSRKGEYPQAQQMLDRALLLEPASTGPYILLGKVLLKRNDPMNAAGYLERAAAMDPGNYMTHNLLGQAYRMLGRADEARRETELSEKLQTKNSLKLETLK